MLNAFLKRVLSYICPLGGVTKQSYEGTSNEKRSNEKLSNGKKFQRVKYFKIF